VFDFLRYANVWEDAAVLARGLRIRPGARVLSIGSAGDNCFALLNEDPALVVAADLNPTQLYLIELKRAVILRLPYAQALTFLGFDKRDIQKRDALLTTQTFRLQVFADIKADLGEAARHYWETHTEDVKKGVIHAGKFERYFRLFARWVLPLIHTRAACEKLLAPKSEAEQRHFYETHWNTRRWRLLFKVFFGRRVMGKIGRDPAFLREVKIPVAEYIFQKAARELASTAAQHNFMLRYNLCGSYGSLLPDYLENETRYIQIRERLDRIVLFRGYVQEAGAEYGPFDAMNLSDIFEYMDEKTFKAVADRLHAMARPGCRIAYWNLMAPRRLSEVSPAFFRPEITCAEDTGLHDRGFYYERFLTDLAVSQK
jgi:S-adenosylmethionine-diacylglycerol 3-amino-3-carboxypropyl transferase